MGPTDAVRRALARSRRRSEADSGSGSGPRTGVVLDLAVGTGAQQLELLAGSDPRLATVTLWVIRPNAEPVAPSAADERLHLMVERLARRDLTAADIDALRTTMTTAPPETARAMGALVAQALAGTPFVLALVGEVSANLPTAFIDRVAGLLGITIHRERSLDRLLADPFVRPACRPLTCPADRLLMEVLLGRLDAVAGAWTAWLATTTDAVDDQPGFASIAPIVQERLALAGVVDAETDRLRGIRRRAWYLDSLLIADAADAIGRLRSVDIEPIVAGDLITAVRAEHRECVRTASRVALLVEPHQTRTALEVLAPMCDDPVVRRPITAIELDRRGRVLLPLATGRQLLLECRWLPQHCSTLVTLPEPDATDTLELDGITVRTLSPTARLLELWATAHMADPAHVLATVVATGELLEHHPDRIDWPRVREACALLQLDQVAQAQIESLPPRLRELVPPSA